MLIYLLKFRQIRQLIDFYRFRMVFFLYSSGTFIGKIRETKKIITYLYLIIAVRSMINFYSSQMVFAAQQQVALNNIRFARSSLWGILFSAKERNKSERLWR